MSHQAFVQTVAAEQEWLAEVEARRIEDANEQIAEMRAMRDEEFREQMEAKFPILKGWK